MINPNKSKEELLNFAKSNGNNFNALDTRQFLDIMISFYLTVRASKCDLKDDGDMLLYQWGVYDYAEEHTFSVDITRQFIPNPSLPIN
jgi:hypothetical protein